MDQPDPMAFLDAWGQLHARAQAAARIASLVPSLTDLLFDLGLGDQVVARTSFCVRPAGAVERVPAIGGPKKIDLDRLLRLGPTHAVVNVDENPKAMADALAAAGVEVIVTHPGAPRDNLGLFKLLGGVFGADAAAAALCEQFERVHGELERAAREWPVRRVLYLIWKDPWMTVSADTYIARTLALARLRAVGSDESARYPRVSIDAALLAGVDLVVFPSEPYPFTDADVEEFRASCGRPDLTLERIDGEIVSWYGSRAISGLEELRAWRERRVRA